MCGREIKQSLYTCYIEFVADIPDGQLVIVAPTNEAFSKALEALDASLEDMASNTELLSSTLAVHIGVASNLDSDTATTLSPTEQLTFMGGGEEVILKELAGDVLAGTGSVMGPVNSAIVIDVVRCPDNKQIVLVADAVLPTALASAPISAPNQPLLNHLFLLVLQRRQALTW